MNLTNLKQTRIKHGMTTNKVAREMRMLLGRYRDIENAICLPNEDEKTKIEKYYGKSIEELLAEVTEDAI